MRNNYNKNLFWYGFNANVKKFFGSLGLFGGVFFSIFGWLANSYGIAMFGIIFTIGGSYLILTGSSQRFDYQRQSGYIMHGGDR